MAKKFVIVNGMFSLGNVDLHRELTKEGDDVKGGGHWHLDKENKKLYLWGHSFDFGMAKREDIKKALEEKMFSPFLKECEIYHDNNVKSLYVLKDVIYDAELIYSPIKKQEGELK